MRNSAGKTLLLAALVLGVSSTDGLLDAILCAQSSVLVRLGTLAPSGSSYHKAILEMGEKWRAASGGVVRLIVYPDGRQGGEADMVRKMRVGQLNAGLLTAVGLSDIDDSVACLQYMPMMFRSWEEVDFVRDKLGARLEKRLLDKGFVMLFWGDAGWAYYFSKAPGVRPADFKRMKIFAWTGDTYQIDLMKTLGFQPVPLETADMLPALQSGLINAVPSTPYYALAGQFDASAPNMLDLKWAPVVGGAVMKKDIWDRMPAAALPAIREAAISAGERIKASSRDENDRSVAAMQKRGLKVHTLTPEMEAEWRQFIQEVHPKIRGKLVPAEWFDEAQQLLDQYRGSGKRGNK